MDRGRGCGRVRGGRGGDVWVAASRGGCELRMSSVGKWLFTAVPSRNEFSPAVDNFVHILWICGSGDGGWLCTVVERVVHRCAQLGGGSLGTVDGREESVGVSGRSVSSPPVDRARSGRAHPRPISCPRTWTVRRPHVRTQAVRKLPAPLDAAGTPAHEPAAIGRSSTRSQSAVRTAARSVCSCPPAGRPGLLEVRRCERTRGRAATPRRRATCPQPGGPERDLGSGPRSSCGPAEMSGPLSEPLAPAEPGRTRPPRPAPVADRAVRPGPTRGRSASPGGTASAHPAPARRR